MLQWCSNVDQEEVSTRATILKDSLASSFTTGFMRSNGGSNHSSTSSCQLSRDKRNTLQVLVAVFSRITELFYKNEFLSP